jgi:hypothetical protein
MSYPSGSASMFSVIARETPAQPDPEPTRAVTVTCSWCLSENVELKQGGEFQIYECKDCGEVFSRPF